MPGASPALDDTTLFTPDSELGALEGMARVLTGSGRYRVVRRFERRDRYAADDGAPKKLALFVDVETTGLDPMADAIIELALVPFEYGVEDGRIYGVGEAVTFLEDPGRPIPEAVTDLTGITDEMVRGQRIDDALVESLLRDAALVVAHNAAFDRKILERRLPLFERWPWACSCTEVPWRQHGCASASLEYILYRSCAEFFDGHRAADDCYAGIHVLASRTHTGVLPFALLLQSARTTTVRIWAIDSPFDRKDALKARRYRWSDGKDGRPKAWYIDVPERDAGAECAWLDETVYAGREPARQAERITARERYSVRA